MAKLLLSYFGKRFMHKQNYYFSGIYDRLVTSNQAVVINSTTFLLPQQRHSSSQPNNQQEKSLQQQTKTEISEDVQPITFKTVKETSKTVSYLGVILVGVGVTGVLFYTVLNELFSSKSPNNVYSKALERVISDPRVQDALGNPISGYGEENRRGRRQHVRYQY